MRLSDINTLRLFPRFSKSNRFIVSLCGTMDYIIKSISDRLDTLPLNAGGYDTLQKCRIDEIAELASECINAPFYPDVSREDLEQMVYAVPWWTWQTGTREVFEYALAYAFQTGSVSIEEYSGKKKHHFGVFVGDSESSELGFKRCTDVIRGNCHVTATPDFITVESRYKITQGTSTKGLVSYTLEGSINA